MMTHETPEIHDTIPAPLPECERVQQAVDWLEEIACTFDAAADGELRPGQMETARDRVTSIREALDEIETWLGGLREVQS